MSLRAHPFIVATDTTTVAEISSALDDPEIKPPEYIIVYPTRSDSAFAILDLSTLHNAPPGSELSQHPDLQTNIGQVDQTASMKDKEQIVSTFGMAIVTMNSVPVELLAPQMYGEEISIGGGIAKGVSLLCPKCKDKNSRPIAFQKHDHHMLFYCSHCGKEWTPSGKSRNDP